MIDQYDIKMFGTLTDKEALYSEDLLRATDVQLPLEGEGQDFVLVTSTVSSITVESAFGGHKQKTEVLFSQFGDTILIHAILANLCSLDISKFSQGASQMLKELNCEKLSEFFTNLAKQGYVVTISGDMPLLEIQNAMQSIGLSACIEQRNVVICDQHSLLPPPALAAPARLSAAELHGKRTPSSKASSPCEAMGSFCDVAGLTPHKRVSRGSDSASALLVEHDMTEISHELEDTTDGYVLVVEGGPNV